jgi:hypothetical protein
MNSHVDVASHNIGIHIASASNYSDGFNYACYDSENYMQKPMSHNMHTLEFNATSNVQHASFCSHTSAAEQVHMPMSHYQGQTNMVSSTNFYRTSHTTSSNNVQQGVPSFYSSTTNSHYVVPPQVMLLNKKIGHADFNYPANYSQPSYDAQHITRVEVASINSAPYTNANNHIPAPNVSNNYSRINENSASTHTPSHVHSACELPSIDDVVERMRHAIKKFIDSGKNNNSV